MIPYAALWFVGGAALCAIGAYFTKPKHPPKTRYRVPPQDELD